MLELLKRFFKICLLTNGPQDLPYSLPLLQIMVFIYFLTGCVSMWPSVPIDDSFWIMLLDSGILLVFCWLCLLAFNKRSRFLQAATALTAIGAVFQLLAWPLLLHINDSKQSEVVSVEASFLLLIIISWNLAVYAHIFRQAFEVRMPAAFVLTIAYVMINITTRNIFFADLGV